MAKEREQVLGDLGELKLIELVRGWLGAANPPAPRGMGDDCAILARRRAGDTLVTVDPVIRGRHFDENTPPASVAAKLLNRNLSDIAAMGGAPRAAVIAVAAPADLPVAWLRGFYRSLARHATRRNMHIVGGDCSQTDGFLGLFLTLLGDAPKHPLTRSGAKIGDVLFVTGRLGGSILGRHLRFTPRLEEGRWLAAQRDVHAAIDLSDGLGKDVFPLIPKDACVVLDSAALPVSAAARKLATSSARHPLDCALNDGEDHELLFAVSASGSSKLAQDWDRRFKTKLTRIGRVRERGAGHGEPRLVFEPSLPAGLMESGYEHFR